ncbi:hypothetical protein [Mycolicibacterium llatzerense]|nr:hypothetical protein [Mycolicibacterium llatzerense]
MFTDGALPSANPGGDPLERPTTTFSSSAVRRFPRNIFPACRRACATGSFRALLTNAATAEPTPAAPTALGIAAGRGVTASRAACPPPYAALHRRLGQQRREAVADRTHHRVLTVVAARLVNRRNVAGNSADS